MIVASKAEAIPMLSCAPRPIRGEFLSSWVRRLAAANAVTFAEFLEWFGNQMGGRALLGADFDYEVPQDLQLGLAKLARVLPSSLRELDLKQQFPLLRRAGLMDNVSAISGVRAAFCPDCYRYQLTSGQALHLKAEWTLALLTRCHEHGTPLEWYCPVCGGDQPTEVIGLSAGVVCYRCGENLLGTPGITKLSPELQLVISLQKSILRSLHGQPPDAWWAGEIQGAAFLRLVEDLIWLLTTSELFHNDARTVLLDFLPPLEFALTKLAGQWNPERQLSAMNRDEREAVVASIALILRGRRAGNPDRRSSGDAGDLFPFDEILARVQRNHDALSKRVRTWPAELQVRFASAEAWIRERRFSRRDTAGGR